MIWRSAGTSTGLAREPPAACGLALPGFAASVGVSGRGLTQQRCAPRPVLEVGMSPAVPLAVVSDRRSFVVIIGVDPHNGPIPPARLSKERTGARRAADRCHPRRVSPAGALGDPVRDPALGGGERSWPGPAPRALAGRPWLTGR
jgi:hypothetical protein